MMLKIQLYITGLILNSKHISQYHCFYWMFGQINWSLVSRRDFFLSLKHKKIFLPPSFSAIVYMYNRLTHVKWVFCSSLNLRLTAHFVWDRITPSSTEKETVGVACFAKCQSSRKRKPWRRPAHSQVSVCVCVFVCVCVCVSTYTVFEYPHLWQTLKSWMPHLLLHSLSCKSVLVLHLAFWLEKMQKQVSETERFNIL